MVVNGRAYAFGPDVRLRIAGVRPARSHFEREYGPAIAAGGPAAVDVDVHYGWHLRAGLQRPSVPGGHKTARWRVALGDPYESPLHAGIRLAGGPPAFALSLVQGFYVEPLVAVALARSGQVALPSAAIVDGAGATVILGRSGTGKSSVSVLALARGRAILGDDQIVVDAAGRCWPFPRRLRLYPDVRETAPAGWARLNARTRAALELRRRVRLWSRGYVAPSLPVPASELSASAPPAPVPATRLLVVERAADVDDIVERPRDADWALQRSGDVLAEQRARFAAAAGAHWHTALADVARQEVDILRAWLDVPSITEVRLPRSWDAPRAVAAIAARVGLAD